MKFTREDLLDENGDLLDITAILDVVNGGAEAEEAAPQITHTEAFYRLGYEIAASHLVQVPEDYAITYELLTGNIITHLTDIVTQSALYNRGEPLGLVLSPRDYRTLKEETAYRQEALFHASSLTHFMGVRIFLGPDTIEPTLVRDVSQIFPTFQGQENEGAE